MMFVHGVAHTIPTLLFCNPLMRSSAAFCRAGGVRLCNWLHGGRKFGTVGYDGFVKGMYGRDI